jgi:hypothetical protein
MSEPVPGEDMFLLLVRIRRVAHPFSSRSYPNVGAPSLRLPVLGTQGWEPHTPAQYPRTNQLSALRKSPTPQSSPSPVTGGPGRLLGRKLLVRLEEEEAIIYSPNQARQARMGA